MTIPGPRTGAVIRYGYLWKYEQRSGLTEGRKNRPGAIILAHEDSISGQTIVYVLPVTLTPPADPAVTVEIPAKTSDSLGLDGGRSWIVCDEVNRFIWPGYDIRPVPGRNPASWEYGMLGRETFNRARKLFLKIRAEKRLNLSDRD